MKTIEQVESQFEQKVVDALRELDLLPQGFKHRVRFHGEKKDKRKTADFEKNWRPDADSIRIWFEPTQEASAQIPEPVTKSATAPPVSFPAKVVAIVSDPLSDLVRALDRAESRRGYDFISLKWFRDAALPSEGFSWASSDATRQNLLRGAIEKRLILTSKVPNPKSPQFPVTAIRLNRLMPEVKTILGGGDDNSLDFHPVEIRGENLSATILRERR
jgi:hypothetical protein